MCTRKQVDQSDDYVIVEKSIDENRTQQQQLPCKYFSPFFLYLQNSSRIITYYIKINFVAQIEMKRN